jgi:hypothetical protein
MRLEIGNEILVSLSDAQELLGIVGKHIYCVEQAKLFSSISPKGQGSCKAVLVYYYHCCHAGFCKSSTSTLNCSYPNLNAMPAPTELAVVLKHIMTVVNPGCQILDA